MNIQTLKPVDVEAYQHLRLRALLDHPEAFGSAYEDEAIMALEKVAERLVSAPERFTLGAWQNEALVGMAGFSRYMGRKTRHRGMVWGMYVAPEARGQGVGAALLAEIIQQVRQLDGLEEIILAVTVGNPAARKIYTQAGFQPSHVEKRYIKLDDTYYDIEWMTLQIPKE
ncbi:MAG: GNAT family N-acetyltransferase [Caldilineaceae bacterium]